MKVWEKYMSDDLKEREVEFIRRNPDVPWCVLKTVQKWKDIQEQCWCAWHKFATTGNCELVPCHVCPIHCKGTTEKITAFLNQEVNDG